MWYSSRKRKFDQWEMLKNPGRYPHIYGNLINYKAAISLKRKVGLQELFSHVAKENNLYLIPFWGDIIPKCKS